MELITLKNGLKFVVGAKLNYNNKKYVYLSSYDDDMNCIFAEVKGNKSLEPISDGETIANLLKLIDEQIKEG